MLVKLVKQTTVETDIDTDVNADTTAGSKTLGGVLGTPEVIAGTARYFFHIEMTAGAGQMKVFNLQVTYDRI